MRRTLVILMMLLLPLQATWAVAASICDHETGTASHFGHHEHQHHGAEVENGADDAGTQPGAYHADCGVCHGVGTAVFGDDSQAVSAWAARDFTAFYSAYLPDPPVEAFLRPPLSLVG
jgi:hypothetical protein